MTPQDRAAAISDEAKTSQATAVVTIQLEVRPHDRWGSDCQLSQVYDQGIRAAIDAVRRMITEHKADSYIRIVGEPTVGAVVYKKDSR